MTDIKKTNASGKKGRKRKADLFGVPGIANLDRLPGLHEVRSRLGRVYAKGRSQAFSTPIPAVLAGGLSASLIGTIVTTKVADGVLSHQTRTLDHDLLDLARGASKVP